MDSAGVAAPFGAWASIRGYFTPATLFLVVNLVIGTIALTSRATQQRRRREHHHYHDDGHGHYHIQEPLHPHQQPAYGDHYYYQQQPQQTLYATPPAPAPAPLARTSSVLDRLVSFGLYRFRSGDFPPEYGAAAGANHAQDAFAPVEEETAAQQAHYARSRSEPAPAREERRPASVKKSGAEVRKAQAARAPPRVVEAVAEDDSVDARAEQFPASFRREPAPAPLQQEHNYHEEYVQPPARAPAPAPAPLARTSSVMDRLRSLGLYGFLAPEQPAAAATPASAPPPAVEKKQAQSHYDRSRSEPAWGQGSNKKEKKQEARSRMAKWSSETRKAAAPSRVEAAVAGESVDARAEAFIDSFRQQQAQHHREEEYVPPPAPAPLSRAPSVLERVRSFTLYRFRSGDLGPDFPAAAAAESTPPTADEKKQAAAHYGRSRSEPVREQGKKEPRMSKSSSVVAEEEEPAAADADQCVDARADDFINLDDGPSTPSSRTFYRRKPHGNGSKRH